MTTNNKGAHGGRGAEATLYRLRSEQPGARQALRRGSKRNLDDNVTAAALPVACVYQLVGWELWHDIAAEGKDGDNAAVVERDNGRHDPAGADGQLNVGDRARGEEDVAVGRRDIKSRPTTTRGRQDQRDNEEAHGETPHERIVRSGPRKKMCHRGWLALSLGAPSFSPLA